jgi:farnesyl diphosphate synthase
MGISWDLFHKTTYQTEMGQLVDKVYVSFVGFFLLFSFTNHTRRRFVVLYKTAYYFFYLSVACAMPMSPIPKPTQFFHSRPTTLI